MSTTLPPTQPSGSISILTLTPSPTTIYTTNLIKFTTILSLSTLQSQPPPIPPEPASPPPQQLTNTKFIILISITSATFFLLIIVVITVLCLYYKYLQKQKRNRKLPTQRDGAASPAAPLPPLSFPLQTSTPTTMQLPPVLYPPSPSLFRIGEARDDPTRPITAPPQRPYRSASTPFLGPEYENKAFAFQSSRGEAVTDITARTPTLASRVPGADASWRFEIPERQTSKKEMGESRVPRFTEEETQVVHPEGSWFEANPEVGRGGEKEEDEKEERVSDEDERRETFDFFRFPIAGAGTRASSGVFPEGGREDG